jgi:DNA gyrase/topoisomerase IV subunit A
MSLKLELESRPTQEDFDVKVQQCNGLRLELSNLTEQMTSNEKLLEQMQLELGEERDLRMQMLEKSLQEQAIQTEIVDDEIYGVKESTKEVPVVMDTSQDDVSSSSSVSSAATVLREEAAEKVSFKMPQSSATAAADDDDDALNNHPKVLYEDELIVFKEKCTNLTAENVRLHREIGELRANMSHFHNTWLNNFMLKYLVPVLILFIAYIFYLLK